ncbi:hypothetical protein HKX48_008306 [Thoreauomyces humboldtii]|nr:hypothetical protein HKX48_008306 [Thoreauomyces humboldtii]
MTTPATIPQRFTAFMEARDAFDTIDAFETLLSDHVPAARVEGRNPLAFYDVLKAAVAPSLPYRQKTLFTVLDAKRAASVSMRPKGFTAKRFLISGAGPCGLRSAVESAVLGHNVTIIELRKDFSRHNIIKTWRTTIQDLTCLGLGQFMPQFQPHGHSHLETRQIQLVLLKTALLFGVNVTYDAGVCGILDPSTHATPSGAWAVWTMPAQRARAICATRSKNPVDVDQPAELSLRTTETDLESTGEKRNKVNYVQRAISENGAVLPVDVPLEPQAEVHEFDALFIGEGENSSLLRHMGFDRLYSRFAEAIGMVVNLEFSPAVTAAKKGSRAPELMLPEFVVARTEAKWQTTMLGELQRSGVDVENVEYMRGLATHFLVVTVKRGSLMNAGVLKEDLGAIANTLTSSNVDIDKLREFARTIASQAGVPSDAPLCQRHGVQLFDFSCKGMSMQSSRILESTASSSAKAIVMPIGDAFQNPFWPQGLGVNRGFQTSLDAVFAAHTFAIDTPEAAEKERAFARRTSEWTAGSDRALKVPTTEVPWTADPISRYVLHTFKDIFRHDHADPSVFLGGAKFWKADDAQETPRFVDADERALARAPMPKRIIEALGLTLEANENGPGR